MSDRFFPFLFHFVRMQRWTFLGIALLTVIRSWGQGYFPYFLKKLLDFISVSSPETLDTNSLFVLLMRLMLCWIIIEISMRFLSWLLMKGFPLLRVNIRKYTFSYLLGHSIDYFEQNLSGSLASKMNELPKHCEKILETFLVSILNTFFLTLFSAFAFYQIGLIYCLLIIGLFISHIGITLLGYKKIHLCNKLQSSTNAHVNGQFVDCLHNIKMIQGSNSEAFEIRRMEKHLKIEAHRYRQSLGS
ncbi:MAG TPA: ABC transporter transmembrane domain-containing protein, partial [Rhabdochlamydiaceae bacterium]|nr:ABC transporter transmembrane domain-containing protein [Rhabdochlamydiaceae bacterium]